MGKDWYSDSRDDQLHTVKTWNAVFAISGYAWGIPQEHMMQLQTDADNAQTILDKVKSGERTPTDIVRCNEIFKSMEAEARFIKKHFLLMPPLTLSDFPRLLLSVPGQAHTPIPAPTGQPSIELSYAGGPHVVTVHLSPMLGTEPPDKKSDYGYSLYRGIMPQGGATIEQAASIKHYLMHEPLSGDELLYYRFTRRKKELVNFDANEYGMKAYFCARYENQKGEYGIWGPVESIIIP
jgi:hypothetical protein